MVRLLPYRDVCDEGLFCMRQVAITRIVGSARDLAVQDPDVAGPGYYPGPGKTQALDTLGCLIVLPGRKSFIVGG